MLDIAAVPRVISAGLLAATGIGCATMPLHAQEAVDVELVLAVDVSLSMSPDELDIQRRGYAAALTHDSVIAAIRDGMHGKIAVTYVEWAGVETQKVVVPWTVIADRDDAAAVAVKLSESVPSSARRTSISSAMRFAADLFAESGYRGMKRVIDISGDGPNNQGEPVVPVRDRIVAQGITINGLPLMTNSGPATAFGIPDLDLYYAHCVIGGPGSFTVPVNEWTQFPEAIRRKLVVELADRAPADAAPAGLIVKAAAQADAVDCLAGEKMWDSRFKSWRFDP